MDWSSGGPNSGGTTDEYWPASYSKAAATCASVSRWPSHDYELALDRAQRHADLMGLLGAVMDGWTVRWWPAPASDRRKSQRLAGGPLTTRSGHKDFRRGRHWDRTRH